MFKNIFGIITEILRNFEYFPPVLGIFLMLRENLIETSFPQRWGNPNSKFLFYFITSVFDAIITWLVPHSVFKQSK